MVMMQKTTVYYKIPSKVTLEDIASAVYSNTEELKRLNPGLGKNIEGATIKVQQYEGTDKQVYNWPVKGDHVLTEAELKQNLEALDKISQQRLGGAASTTNAENTAANKNDQEQTQTTTTEKKGSSLGITTGQSCETGKLIVEIVGEVPESYIDQRIYIYKNNQPDQATTNKLKRETSRTDETQKTGTLHTWDWDSCDQGELYLEIATTKGAPIRLPLMKDAKITPRQGGIHSQLNLIVPVVPMTIIKDRYSLYKKHTEYQALASSNPVLCRAGWIYVYYQGKLWRELQIRQNQTTGETTYHDARLTFDEQGKLKDTQNHQREAEGKALTEIWLPARWNDDAQTIQIFYAESQLTALRLNYLQTNPSALSKRSQSVSMLPQVAEFNGYRPKKIAAQPFLLKTDKTTVKNHLPRNVMVEKHTATPMYYLLDTTGTYLSKEFNKAKTQLQQFDKDTPEPDKRYYIPMTDPTEGLGESINISAFTYQLKEILLQKAKSAGAQQNPNSPDTTDDVLKAKYLATKEEDDKIWKTQQKTTQVLTKALEKKICGLYLADPLFEIQHRQAQVKLSQELQGYIAERASLREQHGNALLVDNIMYASKNLDEESPLYKATKQLGAYGWSKIHFALAGVERKRINDYIDNNNKQLAILFNNSLAIEAIKDLGCYYGVDYLANCQYILTSFNNAATTGAQTDPLSTAFIKKPKETPADTIIEGLIKRDANSPYYKMFFDADYNPVELLDDYQPPKEMLERKGDGSWHPPEIAQLIEKNEADTNLTNPMSLQGIYLSARIQSGFEKFLTADSKLAAAILIYIDVLDSTIKKALVKIEADASNKVESESTLLSEEQRKLKDLQAEADKNNAEQTKLKQQQAELETQYKQTQQQLNTLEAKLLADKQTLYNLDRSLYQAKKEASDFAKRWGNKTPSTITNQEILQWSTTGNPLASQVQQTALEIKNTNIKLAQLQIKRMQIKELLVAQTKELEAKNRQIAETKGKIDDVQQSPAKNKRLKFSKSQRYQFISANTARELLDKDIGLRLDEITDSKPLPANRIILGTDPQAVNVNGTSLLGKVESNRQKLHSVTASVIKVENGKPVAPKGVSPNKVAQAAKQGETVMLSVCTWTVAGNKKFWRTYRQEINKLRPQLDTLIDQANGMADNQSVFLRALKEVEGEIASTEQKLSELEAKKQQQANADYEAKQTADGKVTDIQNQQQQTKGSIESTEQKIGQEDAAGRNQIEQQTTNQKQLDEIAAKQGDNTSGQQRSQAGMEGHQETIGNAKKVSNTAANDLAAMGSHYSKALSLGTKDGAVQELAATRNRLNIAGPLLPAFIFGLEVRNIAIIWEKGAESTGEARFYANLISGGFNTAAAFDLLGAKLVADQQGRYHSAMNARAKFLPTLSEGLQKRLGIQFISRRLALQGAAAIAGAILSIWDLYNSIGTRNTGQIVGYGVITAGAFSLLAATALSGSAMGATIAGLTVGWWLALGFALFVGGAVLVELFTYTPFEEWIKFGPFAEPSSGGAFSRNQYPIEQTSNQEEAYYRLISLLAGIQVNFKEVSDQEWGELKTPYVKPKRAMKMNFTSNLPGLLSNPSGYFTIAEVQMIFGGSRTDEGVAITDYFQQSTPDGINLYFDMEADAAKAVATKRERQKDYYKRNGLDVNDSDISLNSVVAGYVARIQIRIYDKDNKLHVYPAPLPLETKTFELASDGKLPRLHDTDRHVFWLRGQSQLDRVKGTGY